MGKKLFRTCTLVAAAAVGLALLGTPAAAQAAGNIVIVKNSQPDTAQTFDFSGGLGSFTLDGLDGGSVPSQRSFTVAADTYAVTENPAVGWNLSGIACTDPSGGTTTSIPTRTATVSLAAGETVTCTFTNSVGTSPGTPPDLSKVQVGLVDTSQGRWYLLNSKGNAVPPFFYGDPGDVPVMGDWDCDGDDTPGLFRQSDAFAYLRQSNTQGIGDIRFFFGDPSDVPLAGDFDGDGCDSLSIYRPDEQRFYIINELGENEGGLGAADFSFGFGDPGDKPVVGDWDGDGVDEVGLHRESTGFFYWRNSLTTGIADGEIFFGDPNDRFVAGDWGRIDGKDTPAVFRPLSTTFFFRHTLTQGNADSELVFGDSPWLPVAGSFGVG